MILLISLVGTIAAYYMSKLIYQKWHYFIFSPLLICPIIIIGCLTFLHIDYAQYTTGAHYLSNLLGPATVAFAIPIYKNFALIKKYARSIFLSMTIGVIAAFVSTYLFALLLHLNASMIFSLVPRSITTPIAMDISTMLGGNPTMTAIFVIVTGLTGSIIGPHIIRLLSIKSASAKGLMLGMGAHGSGTSTAFSIGELEGTFSSLGMILAAIISLFICEIYQLWLII